MIHASLRGLYPRAKRERISLAVACSLFATVGQLGGSQKAAAFELVPDYKTPGCMAYAYNGRYAVMPQNTFIGPDTSCNPEAKFHETAQPLNDNTLRVTTAKFKCDFLVDREIGQLAYLRALGCRPK